MPGKVNPVIPEAVLMACARVMGNHVTITVAGQSGSLELNVMMPVLGQCLVESVALLAGTARALTDRCVKGIEADAERCTEMVERSLAAATALAPLIGYDEAARLAKKAHEKGLTIREVAREERVLPETGLAQALDPMRMTEPGLPPR
jgi:fumarate hydratase class II